MITINGDIYITNYGQPLNELAEDEQFEDFDELDCDGDCEDCDLYESDECDDDEELPFTDVEVEFDLSKDERFANYPKEYLDLLSKYAKEMYKTDFCSYCICDLLDSLLDEYLEDY